MSLCSIVTFKEIIVNISFGYGLFQNATIV